MATGQPRPVATLTTTITRNAAGTLTIAGRSMSTPSQAGPL